MHTVNRNSDVERMDMDPLFIASPSEEDVASALALWPELSCRRIRPLLITAFGDIYVEADTGEVLVADTIDLVCSHVADSVRQLQQMFSDPEWAEEKLITDLVLLAHERGVARASNQVFSIAPHPCFTGNIQAEQLLPMDLQIWHHICSQLRGAA